MDNFVLVGAYLGLVVVIIVQAFERYFYGEQVQREQAKLLAAVLSKNMNEYTSAVRIEKEEKAPQFEGPSEVPLTEVDDETFMKHIRSQSPDVEEEE